MKGVTKAVECTGLRDGGWVLAVLVDPSGDRPPVSDDCVARMVSIGSEGGQVLEMLVVGSFDESSRKYPPTLDGVLDWCRRVRIYHPKVQSPKDAEDSKCVERLFAEALKKYFQGVDLSTVEEIWQEAFGKKLQRERVNNELVDTENVGEDSGEVGERLEVLSARLLTRAERDQLAPQVADDWIPAIDKSVQESDEGRHWLRHRGVPNWVEVLSTVVGGGLVAAWLWRQEQASASSYEPLSESSLTSLQIVGDVCKRAFNTTAQQMQPVSNFLWARLGVDVCNGDGYGGRLVCTTTHHAEPVCHSFGLPTKFELTTVGEAVERLLAPAMCAIDCNNRQESTSLIQQKTATELAATILNKDVSNLGPEGLQAVGKEIHARLNQQLGCSPVCFYDTCKYNPFEPNTSHCDCKAALFQCVMMHATDNKKRRFFNADALLDFNTNPGKMAEHSTARTSDNIVRCELKCFSENPTS
ncbi:hypothetical protein GNI_147490 [Gregarina niphandrodes]|uniref:Uncharacterized protein n=1 Tax=Gregarina niphandrodes TaxID=110365 RepID=A0A023B0J6_GRENI|nr:hypothetical protein GNI_147490 [Gregarina niphandrodes]EZG44426.1 hypothetical protein GNI_147490 [Gregarina niphandrodes]|eukprot:XP_011134180.1 hypothetical protein GNI_147490 [Gregarina niphandrodes]